MDLSKLIPVDGGNAFIDPYNMVLMARDESGSLRKMDLSPSDVHVDAALSNFATGYKNYSLIADQVMPVVPVDKMSNKYFEYSPDDALATVDGTANTGGGNIPEVTPQLSKTPYSTVQYAIAGFIQTEVIMNEDAPLNIQYKTTRLVMDRLMLNREVRVKTATFTTGNYTGSHIITLGATQKWNGGSASDPVANIQAIQEAALQPITDIAMDLTTWNAFTRNANVQKYTAYKQAVQGIPTMEQRQAFAAFLNLPGKIHVSEARAKDTTGAYPYVWAGNVVLYHQAPGIPVDGFSTASFKTFRWLSPDSKVPDANGVPGMSPGGGITVRSLFNPYRGPRGGNYIVVTHNDAEQFITDKVSGLIVGAVQ